MVAADESHLRAAQAAQHQSTVLKGQLLFGHGCGVQKIAHHGHDIGLV